MRAEIKLAAVGSLMMRSTVKPASVLRSKLLLDMLKAGNERLLQLATIPHLQLEFMSKDRKGFYNIDGT